MANKISLPNLVNDNVEKLENVINKLATLQPITDPTIKTDDKTVPGSINSLKDEVDNINGELANKVNSTDLTANYLNRDETIREITSRVSNKMERTAPYETFESLPDEGDVTKIYLVKREDGFCDEYIWNTEKNAYDAIGTNKTDLAAYYTKEEVDDLLSQKDTEILSLNTLVETLKNKINEIISGTSIVRGEVIVGADEDGTTFTIADLDGVDPNKVTIYAMGTKLLPDQYEISGTTLTLTDPLLQDQYVEYIINKVEAIS